MKYLHIMNNEKFNEAYIVFIEKNFNMNEHYFVFWGGVSEDEIPILKRENILKIKSKKDIIKLLYFMNKKVKIYLHNLFNDRLLLILYLHPWVLNRCNWIIWGADLYNLTDYPISFKSKIIRRIRLSTIKRFGEVSTLVKGDYDLAKSKYNIKGKYKEGFYPPKLNYKDLDNLINSYEKNNTLFIQIGNSADKRNNHIEVLNELIKFKEENIKIFCPLSYGDKEYANYISEYGTNLFGDKFVPMLDFMPYSEYIEYLNSIDIAIFNNDRQQALGNIYLLLYFGKKVFIRSDTTMWKHFTEKLGVHVYDALKIKNINFSQFKTIDKNINLINREYTRKIYTEEYAVTIWEKNLKG